MSDVKSSISEATSYQEMGKFWDSHDLGYLWDKTESVEFEVVLDASFLTQPSCAGEIIGRESWI